MKVAKNVIINNIELHYQPSRIHHSPPRNRQNFRDSKNSKIWQIWQRYFRYDHRVFWLRWKLTNDISNSLYLDKFPILHRYTILMLFYILHSSFRFGRTVFWSKWITLTMLFTRTLNTMTNSRKCNVFSLGASKFDQKPIFFLQNGLILPTSEALGVKTVCPRELITKYKVIYNVSFKNHQIWPDSVLIWIKVFRNDVMNKFEFRNKLSKIHSFHSKSLWS